MPIRSGVGDGASSSWPRFTNTKPSEVERLEVLTPRENNAIADRLHLSIKTVEPVVSSIFIKLGLPGDADSNRRVLAVVEYLRR